MANTHGDGGPAFPQGVSSHDGGATCSYDFADGSGMSLRDYFAAEASRGAADALCDMLTPDDPMETFDPVQRMVDVKRHADQHAMVAYLYADAMLRARTAQSPRERQDAHLAEWGK